MTNKFDLDVDIFIGKQIRTLRRSLNLTQTLLGNKIGITFQQIQKYEKGLNKISSSRLYNLSLKLNTPITYFFDQSINNNSAPSVHSNLSIEENNQEFIYEVNAPEQNLIEVFKEIKSKKNKDKLLNFLKEVAKD